MTKNPSEFVPSEPFSNNNHSTYSLPSGDANHTAWDTNLNENLYHPVHFDRDGTHENPITATYNATDADNIDNDDDSKSYCGGPPSKSCQPAFDIQDYTNPKTKEYSNWYNTKLDAKPPAELVYFYVAAYYCKEIALIDKEH